MITAYAAFEAKGDLKRFEYDPGVLKPDEVEINVDFCGICHGDINMLDNEWDITQYPFVPGHEVIGTVAQMGERVRHLSIGQTVGLGWFAGYCNECVHCHSGDHNLCAGAHPTIIGRHGGFADKVRAAANSVIPIPEGTDLESAGPLLCAGITVFNPLVQFDVKPTDKVGVIGIGGLGHLALQFFKAWGCDVTAFTSSDAKKAEVLELGAHHAINSRNQAEIEAAAGKFDFIISTVDADLNWNAYIGALRPKGRLHFVGIPKAPLDVMVFPLLAGQRSISASPNGSPINIEKMLKFASRHKIKPIIEKYRFDQINEAIERLRSGKARYRIILVK